MVRDSPGLPHGRVSHAKAMATQGTQQLAFIHLSCGGWGKASAPQRPVVLVFCADWHSVRPWQIALRLVQLSSVVCSRGRQAGERTGTQSRCLVSQGCPVFLACEKFPCPFEAGSSFRSCFCSLCGVLGETSKGRVNLLRRHPTDFHYMAGQRANLKRRLVQNRQYI